LRRLWCAATVVAIGLGVLYSLSATAQPWDPRLYMGVDELQRGQRGYLLTALEGSKPEKLEIEILSVEPKWFAKGDLIWAIGVGERFRHMGPVAGMSGSPVYVGDRLIGAMAYGYSFPKDPILGITPIAQMLSVWDRDMVPKPPIRTQKLGLAPVLSPDEWFASLSDPHGKKRTAPVITDDVVRRTPELDYLRGAELLPVRTPVALSGFRGDAATVLQAALESYGMMVLQSGGGGQVTSSEPAGTTVVPGAPLGVEMVRGDLGAFGFGTVTHREGNRFLAFGHPFFSDGDSYLPVSAGYIHFVFASLSRSFKIGSPTGIVGTLVQDREPAIAGVLDGTPPAYLPLQVTIDGARGKERQTYNYEIVRQRQLTTSLALSSVMATMTGAEKDFGDYTIRAKSRIEFADGSGFEPFEREEIMSGQSSPGSAVARMLFPVSTMLNNWFEELPIRSMALSVQYEDRRTSAAIESVRLGKTRVRPGDTIEVAVTYHPYLDDPVVRRYTVRVPENAPEGFALLFVGDAGGYQTWERSRAMDRFQAQNAHQLLALLREGESQDRLVASLVTLNAGVAMAGNELSSLPLSMLSVMDAASQDGEGNMTRGSVLTTQSFDTPFVLSGNTLLPITIDRDAP